MMAMMKLVVLLGDGMADLPLAALQGKTPLQAAKKPNMDILAKQGRCGLAGQFQMVFRREAMWPIFLSWAIHPASTIPVAHLWKLRPWTLLWAKPTSLFAAIL